MLATDMGQCGTTEKEETMHIELSDEFVSSNIMGPNTVLIPEEMLLSWTPEDLSTMHSCSWWENLLGPSDSIDIVSIGEMACFDQAWTDWLACDNEYARADRAAMEAGAGAFMNLVAIKALKR